MAPSEPCEAYESLRIPLICEDCGEDPPNLEHDLSAGDIICKSCGRVVADHLLDESPEWNNRYNDNDGPVEDKSRVGKAASNLLFGAQLQTTIASGAYAPQTSLTRSHKDVSQEKTNTHLLSIYGQIDTLCSSISVTHAVSENAKQVYKNAVTKGYWRIIANAKTSKSQQTELARLATCLIVACRAEGVSRGVKEISELVGVEFKQLSRELRGYQKADSKHHVGYGKEGGDVQPCVDTSNASDMGVETSVRPQAPSTSVEISQVEEMIPRFASRLNPPLLFATTQKAQSFAAEINTRGLAGGRRPTTVVAVCLHFATKDLKYRPSVREISKVVGISDTSIHNLIKILEPSFKNDDGKLTTER